MPVVAGLLYFLGHDFLVGALAQPLAQCDWPNLLLAVAIMAACARYG